jgi:type I restriction enzyme, R subunit
MMTTGYDCPDLLNLGLFRPIFSPTDFIQIKGRGTRKHNFLERLFDNDLKESVKQPRKTAYKLFDFFANCEYFEEEFNYDEILKLPKPKGKEEGGGNGPVSSGTPYEHLGADIISSIKEEIVGYDGMKIDRMFYEKFEDAIRENPAIVEAVEAGQWDRVIDYVNREVFDKPNEFYTLDKIRKAAAVDRRLSLREILEKIFGLIPRFKSRDELLEEEFSKFVADYKLEEAEAIPALKNYFKAYATSDQIRHIIDTREYTDLATNPIFSTRDLRAVPEQYRSLIPNYIKDYVPLNQFSA